MIIRHDAPPEPLRMAPRDRRRRGRRRSSSLLTAACIVLALSAFLPSAAAFLPLLPSRGGGTGAKPLQRQSVAEEEERGLVVSLFRRRPVIPRAAAIATSSTSSSFSSAGERRRKSNPSSSSSASGHSRVPITPSAGKAKRSRAERGRQLDNELARINAAGPRADFDLFQKALRSCAKLGNVSVALTLLRQMQQHFPPPRLAYNLVLEAAARAQDREVALDVYVEMLRGREGEGADGEAIGVNVFTYGQLLSLYANLADGPAALALLGEMAVQGVAGNAFTYTSAIDACERAGLVGETERLLREMKERGVAPTVVTYNTIIARRAEQADTWTEALDWLAKLEASGVQPLRSSYAAALNACERAEEWELVVELTERAGPLADATMWSRNLAALTKLVRHEEALATFRRLREEQTVPMDEVLYTLALKACALARRPFGEARALLEEMRAAGLAPTW